MAVASSVCGGSKIISFSFLRYRREVMYMVTWELLFQFCMLILAILTFVILFIEFINKKK